MSDYTAKHAGDPAAGELLHATVGGDLPPLKPGYATTEFWVTVLTTVASLAVALGWIGPNFVKDHDAVVNAVALLASVIAPAAYALGRSITKGKHQAAAGALASAQLYAPPLRAIEAAPLP